MTFLVAFHYKPPISYHKCIPIRPDNTPILQTPSFLHHFKHLDYLEKMKAVFYSPQRATSFVQVVLITNVHADQNETLDTLRAFGRKMKASKIFVWVCKLYAKVNFYSVLRSESQCVDQVSRHLNIIDKCNL